MGAMARAGGVLAATAVAAASAAGASAEVTAPVAGPTAPVVHDGPPPWSSVTQAWTVVRWGAPGGTGTRVYLVSPSGHAYPTSATGETGDLLDVARDGRSVVGDVDHDQGDTRRSSARVTSLVTGQVRAGTDFGINGRARFTNATGTRFATSYYPDAGASAAAYEDATSSRRITTWTTSGVDRDDPGDRSGPSAARRAEHGARARRAADAPAQHDRCHRAALAPAVLLLPVVLPAAVVARRHRRGLVHLGRWVLGRLPRRSRRVHAAPHDIDRTSGRRLRHRLGPHRGAVALDEGAGAGPTCCATSPAPVSPRCRPATPRPDHGAVGAEQLGARVDLGHRGRAGRIIRHDLKRGTTTTIFGAGDGRILDAVVINRLR